MNNIAKFDPLLFKFHKGTISKVKEVLFKLEVSESAGENEVYLMIKEDADQDYTYEKMQKHKNYYELTKKFDKSGHFWFSFKINFVDLFIESSLFMCL